MIIAFHPTVLQILLKLNVLNRIVYMQDPTSSTIVKTHYVYKYNVYCACMYVCAYVCVRVCVCACVQVLVSTCVRIYTD